MNRYRSGWATSLDMICSMLHCCSTQISQISLAYRRWTQLLLLLTLYRRVSVLSDAGLMNLCKMTEFSDTQQGHYVRDNTLMSNEELCEKARVYVRANAAPRGRPNLTSSAFCQWVNNDLLPNSVLEPGYPAECL